MIELYLGRLENKNYTYWGDNTTLFYVKGYSKSTENTHYLIELDDDYLEYLGEGWFEDEYYKIKYVSPIKILSYIKTIIIVSGELKITETKYLQHYGENFNEQRKCFVFSESAFERYMKIKRARIIYESDNVIYTEKIIKYKDDD